MKQRAYSAMTDEALAAELDRLRNKISFCNGIMGAGELFDARRRVRDIRDEQLRRKYRP